MLKKILRYLDPAITLSFKDMELGGRTKKDTPDIEIEKNDGTVSSGMT